MPYEWDNYQALITVPATDDNFKLSLKNATDDELVRAIQYFERNPKGNKARSKAANHELLMRPWEAKS